MAGASAQDRLRAVTEELWEKSREKTEQQVVTIERAVMCLVEGRLGEETRAAAEREAHKIAGSAGMFGFHRASEIARDLELFFSSRPGEPASAIQAAAKVESLRAILVRDGDGVDGATKDHGLEASPAPSVGADGLEIERRASKLEKPAIVLTGLTERLATAVAMHARTRGLLPETVEPMSLSHRLGAARPPAAAVVQVAGVDSSDDVDVVRVLDQRGVVVVALLARDAGTAVRLAALRAGARLLLDTPPESAAGAAQIADAVATLVESRDDARTRILAVDDDETLLLLIRDTLAETTGAQVAMLSDPQRFWSELNRVQPDLVLIDVEMPGVSGLELCRLVRSDPKWRQLPVVFLSGRFDPTTVDQVYSAGADDFVSKPVQAMELHARIANRLERTRLHRLLAETDPLTGLANRRRLELDLQRLRRIADRHGVSLSLAVVDLDRFKQVNDRYGHAAGDAVLRAVATHLRDAFRGEDVVARLGGEEFVVAMVGMRREDGVERLGTVLAALASTELSVDQQLLRVSASAGVAQYGPDGTDFEALYRAADGALRVAKATGRGRVLPAGAASGHNVREADVAIVEDDEVLAELLRHTLTVLGYRCVVLPDGVQAVGRLTDAEQPLRVRAVLLDIDLPGRSGFEVLHALHQAEVTSRCAVIVVTGRSTEEDAVRALRSGATDHVSKPFSVPLLVEKLRRVLSDVQ